MENLYKSCGKRIMDLLLSSVGLVATSPLFLLVALAIKREDGGSVFFKQERVGKGWKTFKVWKFRTMVENAERLGLKITAGKDPRITRVGRFLRKYKIDELPQLINVVKGDMSLVGPRPEVFEYASRYKEDYDYILKVKPGITDFAALEFIDEEEMLKDAENPEEYYINHILPKKIELYKEYIKRQSFLTDVGILLRTLMRIVRRDA